MQWMCVLTIFTMPDMHHVPQISTIYSIILWMPTSEGTTLSTYQLSIMTISPRLVHFFILLFLIASTLLRSKNLQCIGIIALFQATYFVNRWIMVISQMMIFYSRSGFFLKSRYILVMASFYIQNGNFYESNAILKAWTDQIGESVVFGCRKYLMLFPKHVLTALTTVEILSKVGQLYISSCTRKEYQ